MNFEKRIDHLTESYDLFTVFLKEILVSSISFISLASAPLAPSITFGFALFKFATQIIGHDAALIAGIGLALTLEGAGLISAKVALNTYEEYDRNETGWEKLALSVSLVFAYLVIGIAAVWYFDPDPKFRVIGTLAFLVALLIYCCHALLSSTKNREKRIKSNSDSRVKLREIELTKENELKLKTKQIEVDSKTKVQLARVKSKSNSSRIPVKLTRQSNGIRNQKRKNFIDYVKLNPDSINNVAELTRSLGMSRTTVDKWLNEYQSNGIIEVIESNGTKRIEVK